MSKQYGVRLDGKLVTRLEAAARKDGRADAEMIRIAFERGFPLVEADLAAGKSPVIALQEAQGVEPTVPKTTKTDAKNARLNKRSPRQRPPDKLPPGKPGVAKEKQN